MTREDAERKIRSVFTNYFRFAGDREADEVIEALKQKPSYQLVSHNDNDEAKSVLFDMLGKGIYVKDTKENRAILAALRALEREPLADWKFYYNHGYAQAKRDLRCKWIPVSERLPEIDVQVLVTDDAGGLATVHTDSCGQYEGTGERFWYASQCVTAWMQLPEPYKAESKIKQASAYADQDTLMPAT